MSAASQLHRPKNKALREFRATPRVGAAALAIEMLVALLVVHLSRGYAASGGGYEYVLLIGVACFLIAIRGGGPYSVDRFIGKEL